MNRYIEYEPIMAELEREVELADDWKTAHEIANVVKYAPSIEIALADDGTLLVEVKDATKVKRVLVEDGKSGDLYYVDRPQGEWKNHDDERAYCSRCKHIFKTRTITKQDKWTNYIDDLGYNYCPNCGADMREREGE